MEEGKVKENGDRENIRSKWREEGKQGKKVTRKIRLKLGKVRKGEIEGSSSRVSVGELGGGSWEIKKEREYEK